MRTASVVAPDSPKRPNTRTTCRPQPRTFSRGLDGIRAFADTRTDGKVAPGSTRALEGAFSGTTAWRQREAHSLRSARRRKRRVVVTPDNRDKMPANQPARPNLNRLRGCRRLGKLGLPPKRGEVAVTDIPADVAGSARPSRRLRCARVARLLGFIALCDGGMRDGYPDVEPPTVRRCREPMSHCGN
jgi:hypothetical protein